MEENKTQNPQVVIVDQRNKNGIGLTGFILALISLIVGFIPVVGWIVWVLGAIFSIIGLFKKPRGFAIAGFIISFIDIILLITVFGAIAIS